MALYHTSQGSVSYTLVGNPTIVDGVASGFSSSDYLSFSQYPDLSKDFEINICVSPTDLGAGTLIGTNNYYYQGIYFTNNGKFVFRLAGVDSSNNDVNVTVDSGTNIYSSGHNYQILSKRENQTVTMVIKQDGTQVFSGNATIPSDFTLRTIYAYQIGKGPDGYWKGTIDLNNTHISVNGQAWFGKCPVEVQKLVHDGGSEVSDTVTGTNSLSLPNAKANGLISVTAYGVTEQNGTPTPSDPINIVSNNGVIKVNSQGQIYTDGTQETIEDTISNTATAEILLKVGNYKDQQEILSGTVTRNVGVKVFDGTENWNSYDVTQGVLFRTQIADSVSSGKDALGVLCNAYQVVASGFRGNGTLTGSATNYDFINDNYTTIDAWKAYLADQYAAGSPVIVVYPLETPTTETVTGQTLQTQAGANTLTATGSLSDLVLSATYTKMAPAEVNYVIRENPATQEQHLVYAKPNMYLAGPVNYTLQGATTVTDGIATPFNYYNRVVVSQSTKYSSNSNCEFYVRFKAPSTFEAEVKCIFSFGTNPNNGLPNAIISNYGGALIFSDGGGGVYLENLSTDTWYRVKAILQNGSYDVTHYADDGTVLKHLTGTLGAFDLGTSNFEIGRTNQTDTATYSFEIDLNNTYIIKDGSLWFYGKNYSSKNIAPVPAGFTYGTTTTNAIGFVDMRNQAFTAAPAGTGYNEVPSRTIDFTTATLDKINAYAYSFQLNGVGASEGTTGSVKLKSITLYPPDNFPDTLVYETVYMNIFERTLNSLNAYIYTGSSSNATRLYDPSLTATWNFADLGLSSTKDYIVLFSKAAPSSTFESIDYIRAVIYKHDTTDVQNMGTRFGNAGGVYSTENPPVMNGIWSPKMAMVIAGE